MKNNKFKFLKHTADLKFKAWGRDLEEMFENCALAISHIFSRDKKIESIKKKKISISGKDDLSILYKFIEELIYLFDADGLVVSKAEVKVKKGKLDCLIYCDDPSKYEGLDAIKSPTYAEMYVKKIKNIWECQVVLDV